MTNDITSAGAELARRTRAAQGLTATHEEPSAIADIAAVAAAALRRAGRMKNAAGPTQARRRNTTDDHPSSREKAVTHDSTSAH